jgi:hypothetical protein
MIDSENYVMQTKETGLGYKTCMTVTISLQSEMVKS